MAIERGLKRSIVTASLGTSGLVLNEDNVGRVAYHVGSAIGAHDAGWLTGSITNIPAHDDPTTITVTYNGQTTTENVIVHIPGFSTHQGFTAEQWINGGEVAASAVLLGVGLIGLARHAIKARRAA